jgi:predicted RNase H-like nuclease
VPVRLLRPVLGVDGCRGRWLAASVVGDERDVRSVRWVLGRFEEVLTAQADPEVVAVDIPLGLAESGRRACDLAARRELGGAAASRVFLVPPRAALEAPTYEAANALLRARGEPAVSRQTYALRRAVLEVDAHLADPRVHEVHPELSFTAMAGCVLTSKHTVQGRDERRAALSGWLDVDDALARRPPGAPEQDALDALAAAWTATRVRYGSATVHPVGTDERYPAIRV